MGDVDSTPSSSIHRDLYGVWWKHHVFFFYKVFIWPLWLVCVRFCALLLQRLFYDFPSLVLKLPVCTKQCCCCHQARYGLLYWHVQYFVRQYFLLVQVLLRFAQQNLDGCRTVPWPSVISRSVFFFFTFMPSLSYIYISKSARGPIVCRPWQS